MANIVVWRTTSPGFTNQCTNIMAMASKCLNRPFKPPDFKFIQIKYRCVYTREYTHTYFTYSVCVPGMNVYACRHSCICSWPLVLATWLFASLQNLQAYCSDSSQCYLLHLHGHPGFASDWRTSARHCTCSLQTVLRL